MAFVQKKCKEEVRIMCLCLDPSQRVQDFIKAHDDESSLGAYPNVNLVEEQTNDQKLT